MSLCLQFGGSPFGTDPLSYSAPTSSSISEASLLEEEEELLHFEGSCVLSDQEFSMAVLTHPKATELVLETPGHLSSTSISSIASLENLQYLDIGDISTLADPQAFFNALYGLGQLSVLHIGFGAFQRPSDARHAEMTGAPRLINPFDSSAEAKNSKSTRPYSDCESLDMSSLRHLSNLTELKLFNVPRSWSSLQGHYTSTLERLKTLEISYRCPPTDLSFLHRLLSLKSLRLTCPKDSNDTRRDYTLPFMPQIEEIDLAQWSIDPTSLLPLRTLQWLKFTPWNWERRTLPVFASMPNLKRLHLKLNWLPRTLDKIFCHLSSLTLTNFDVQRFHTLYSLQNLDTLCLEAPSYKKTLAPADRLDSTIPKLLHALPNLIGFGLINVAQPGPEIVEAILKQENQICRVELSGTRNFIDGFVQSANSLPFAKIREIIAHVEGSVYRWMDENAVMTVSRSSFSYPDYKYC